MPSKPSPTISSCSLKLLATVQGWRPGLILLDINMPYLNGWDELRLLHINAESALPPVIVVTGDRSALDDVDDAAAYGVVDHLFKPFELRELLAKVERVLAI